MKKTTQILWMALTMMMLMVSCTKESNEKQILSFRFEPFDIEAVIVEEAKTISATLPSDADVTNLVPTIVVSEKATVNPVSGVPMDFTNPVTYTVTAEDGSQITYQVTVILEPKSDKKRILSFKFEGFEKEFVPNEDLSTIEATLPWGTDVTALVPVITISEKATINPASGVPTDFTHPVTYTVTAEDGSYAYYVATVTLDTPFVGTWGVERIDYYNTDYAGNPIVSSLYTVLFDPSSFDNGIQLLFREDGTGEIRDSAIDTLWLDWNDELGYYETVIICPDTVLVTTFTYTYDFYDSKMYMNQEDGRVFALDITELTPEAFVYENEYYPNSIEKAYLKKLSDTPAKSTGKKSQFRPRKQGSLLGGR